MGRAMLLLVVVLPLSGCMKDTRNCLDDNSCETATPTESTRLIRLPFYYCHGASEDGASKDGTSKDGTSNDSTSNSITSNDSSWDCSQEAAAHKITTMPDKTDTEATKEATKEDADSEETAEPEEADSEEAL